MAQVKGKGLFYFFNGILVLLNEPAIVYPAIDVWPFLPLSLHLGTEDAAQGPVNFSWVCEHLGTNLPELSPVSKETSFSGSTASVLTQHH